MTGALSQDEFLGGRLALWQPKIGYRAGIDPVLLAASVPAKPGQSLLELGCGVGTAMLCLGARVPGLVLSGLELQADYADLARRNAQENTIEAEVITGDLAQMPEGLRQRRFDHVIANPPYFDRKMSVAGPNAARETAMGEDVPLEAWVRAAAKRTLPGGYVSLIHRAERLPDLLAAMSGRLGSVQVLPLIPRPGRAARLVLIRGRHGGRADFRLLDGFVLHDGANHAEDRENYTDATACILRRGAALPFPI